MVEGAVENCGVLNYSVLLDLHLAAQDTGVQETAPGPVALRLILAVS